MDEDRRPQGTWPVPRPGDPVADVRTLEAMLGVPVGTLQRWAHTDRWPRRHTTTARGRRTLYCVHAARRSYLSRRVAVAPPPAVK